MTTLVIVESPAKAHKIQEYLGKNYIVAASKGHITELAKGGKHGLGVDINNNFRPHYVLAPDKLDVMDNLIALAKQCDIILMGSDNDREGESIAWHVATRLADVGKPIKRIVFNEIKKDKILQAVKNPRDIDMNIVHSQEARRILDRLVGFTASPFLMNFFDSNNNSLSAGRVQSVLTRMIIEREYEIENFVPEDFWTIQVRLTDGQNSFITKYANKLTNLVSANTIKTVLSNPDYVISQVIAAPENKYPPPPLVTATLQRLMSKQHGFDAERTMRAAQSLYEGGYCSYIRTDSVRASDDSISELRQWLKNNNYQLPLKPYIYKNKETAQDAHECIRPSDITLLPWDNFAIIDPDEKQVYEVIWKQFVTSQMMPAVYNTLSVMAHPIINSKIKVKASGKAIKSKGYLEIMGVSDEGSINIPNLSVGQKVKLDSSQSNAVKMEKKQTQPPPRYSEDKIIKELVNKNIGRPATYSELLSKIATRNYVERRGSVFHATELGKTVTNELSKYFTFMDYNYTALLEKKLDDIGAGEVSHLNMLKDFYAEYKQELNKAYAAHNAKQCSQCGSPMSLRTAKSNGSKFWGCINFPTCKTTKPWQA